MTRKATSIGIKRTRGRKRYKQSKTVVATLTNNNNKNI
jgi:hypothetical protein